MVMWVWRNDACECPWHELVIYGHWGKNKHELGTSTENACSLNRGVKDRELALDHWYLKKCIGLGILSMRNRIFGVTVHEGDYKWLIDYEWMKKLWWNIQRDRVNVENWVEPKMIKPCMLRTWKNYDQEHFDATMELQYLYKYCIDSKITIDWHPISINKNISFLCHVKPLLLVLLSNFQLDTNNKSWSKACCGIVPNPAKLSEGFGPTSDILWWSKVAIS